MFDLKAVSGADLKSVSGIFLSLSGSLASSEFVPS